LSLVTSHRLLQAYYTRLLTHLLVSTLHIAEALNCLRVTCNRYANSIWAALFWCDSCTKKFPTGNVDVNSDEISLMRLIQLRRKLTNMWKCFEQKCFVPDSKRTWRKGLL